MIAVSQISLCLIAANCLVAQEVVPDFGEAVCAPTHTNYILVPELYNESTPMEYEDMAYAYNEIAASTAGTTEVIYVPPHTNVAYAYALEATVESTPFNNIPC